jgi:hypothetical protein
MSVKVVYNPTKGLFQTSGEANSTEASFKLERKDDAQEVLSLHVDRSVALQASKTSGVREVSGSVLSLKGRQEGIHFHVGGNQYISNNCWFDATHPENPFGRWVYESTSGGAFRWGFLASSGMFELDWSKSGVAGQVITGSSNAEWGTGLSMTASIGAIGIGKRSRNGLSATLDVTGSNHVAVAVTGSVDIGGGAVDSFFAVPRLTTDQRNALTSVFDGQIIYNTSDGKFQGRAAGAWVNLH